MMAAARYGHSEVIKRLLKEKHSGGLHTLNEARTSRGHPLPFRLFHACPSSGSSPTDVRHLPRLPQDDNSCLHISAKHGQLECLKVLIAAGSDVNAKNKIGVTALHLAADGGHGLCLVELLAGGADINARSKGGWTALHYAAGAGRDEATARLLDAGADAAAVNDVGFTPQLFAAGNGQKGHVLRLLSMATRDQAIDKGKSFLRRLQDMLAREEFFESQGMARANPNGRHSTLAGDPAQPRAPMTTASGSILLHGVPLDPVLLQEDAEGAEPGALVRRG